MSKRGRTYRHRKRCSVFLEGVEILRVHEFDSELREKGGKGLDRERGTMETLREGNKVERDDGRQACVNKY
jgi:hypothetical protein